MGTDALITLVVLGLMIVGLVQERLTPDVVVLGALVILMLLGVVEPQAALAGFASPTVFTVGALFVLAAAMRRTGAIEGLSQSVLGPASTLRQALVRVASVTSVASAFLNNTPIVAMFLPAVVGWCQRRRISPSKLLIPLSYAAIVGGVCTLIGTSTNLVVSQLLEDAGRPGFAMFELAWVGVPCAAVALLLMVGLGPRLLPDRSDVLPAQGSDRREYLVDMRLAASSPLVGKTVEAAGLRHLPGLFLVRIERESSVQSPVAPSEVLRGDDLLSFAGALETIVDLQRFRGLDPAEQDGSREQTWTLHEAVVSPGSPLVGTSIRDAGFRTRYGAAVIAVHRHGEMLRVKIGDVVLQPGDTLLIEAAPSFARSFRDSTDFYLVSTVADSESPRYRGQLAASFLLVGVVGLAAAGILPIVLAALGGAMGAIALRCITPGEARRSIDASVLIVIASALGIAHAIDESGLAASAAHGLVELGERFGTYGVLVAIYLVTMLLTEVITNNAAAALVFPVALAAANETGGDVRPFAVAVAVAASLSLATPLGYQTNLMVWGPGSYRFSDFVRIGLPLQGVLAGVALVSITWAWGI